VTTVLQVRLAAYACPLIDPPSQRHMFENKIHNIELAISRMEPLVLAPGQAFSFWQRALAPTLDNGYREGAMFVNRRVVGSVGGGLCQLSGVIYNLALLAGLQILERHNHSIDAYGEERYIPLGCDATVAFGRKDLRFRNPHRFPVALELNVDRSRVSGRVTGGQPLDCAIRIETALIRTIASPRKRVVDPEVAVGEEIVEPGLTGKVVRAWRVFERPGQSARREALSRDRYRETPTRVRYGARTTPWPVRVRNLFGLHG
jgi:vancomycin resistance protein YoaR